MRNSVAVVFVFAVLAACGRHSSAPRQQASTEKPKTIDSADARPAVLDPPPVLTDEGPAPKPKGDLMSPDAPPPPTPQDDALRAALPFAPAIGLDPVNGIKISIRANTPSLEYKGRVYYFSGEDTKRTFQASPDQYMKGVFAHS